MSKTETEDRVEVFLDETLPEVNKIVENYSFNDDFFQSNDDAKLNKIGLCFQNDNTGNGTNDFDVMSDFSMLDIFAKTPLTESTTSSNAHVPNPIDTQSSKVSATKSSCADASPLSFPPSLSSNSMESVNSRYFLENIDCMLDNIRDYAEYVREYKNHRDYLQNRVLSVLHECYAICTGRNKNRYNMCDFSGGMHALKSATMSSAPSANAGWYETTTSESSLMIAPEAGSSMLRCGSVGATPVPKPKRRNMPTDPRE